MYRQLTKSDCWDRKLLICVKIQLTSYGTSSTQGDHGVFQGIMGLRVRVRAWGLKLLYICFGAFVFGF